MSMPPLLPFFQWQWLDVLDCDHQWLEAQVIELLPDTPNRPVRVHFRGWGSRYDTCPDLKAIAQLHTHIKNQARSRPIAFCQGQEIEAFDSSGMWRKGRIAQIDTIRQSRVMLLTIQWDGWSDTHNERLYSNSRRIRRLTRHLVRPNFHRPSSHRNCLCSSMTSTCTNHSFAFDSSDKRQQLCSLLGFLLRDLAQIVLDYVWNLTGDSAPWSLRPQSAVDATFMTATQEVYILLVDNTEKLVMEVCNKDGTLLRSISFPIFCRRTTASGFVAHKRKLLVLSEDNSVWLMTRRGTIQAHFKCRWTRNIFSDRHEIFVLICFQGQKEMVYVFDGSTLRHKRTLHLGKACNGCTLAAVNGRHFYRVSCEAAVFMYDREDGCLVATFKSTTFGPNISRCYSMCIFQDQILVGVKHSTGSCAVAMVGRQFQTTAEPLILVNVGFGVLVGMLGSWKLDLFQASH